MPRGYLALSRAPLHSLASVAPLVLLHAALAAVFRPPVVAAAAQWVQAPLLAVGLESWQATVVIAVAFLVAAALLGRRELLRTGGGRGFRFAYVPAIWVEGAAWGLALHVGWNRLASPSQAAPDLVGLGPADELCLALGAGIYEEVVFRVALFGVVLALLCLPSWLRDRPVRLVQWALAVLVTSVLFAAAHHVGGEEWTIGALLFRTIAAVYLTTLLAARGLGIAVAAHAAYDVLVGFG